MKIDDDNVVDADIVKEDDEIDEILRKKYQKIIQKKEYLQVNLPKQKLDLYTQSVIRIMKLCEEYIEEHVVFTHYQAGDNTEPMSNVDKIISAATDDIKEKLIQ